MATPGWYPDPAGQPGAFRFWDGSAWGADLTDNPYAPHPGSGPVAPSVPESGLDEPTRYPGTPGTSPSAEPPTAVAPAFPPGQNDPAPYPPAPYQPAPYQPAPYQPQPSAPSSQQPGQQPGQQPSYQPGYPAQAGWSGGAAAPGSWGGSPQSPGGPPKGGGGKVAGLALLAVVMVLVLGVGTFFVVRALTDDDGDTRASDDTSSTAPTDTSSDDPSEDPSDDPSDDPTEDPSEDPSEDPTDEPVDPFTDSETPTTAQCAGGMPATGVTGEQGNQLTGGGLRMKKVPGFATELDQAAAFEFADGVLAPSKEIERTETTGWVAVYALGGLSKVNGFTSLGQAAGVVLECMSLSPTFYTDFTGATLLDSQATTVGGADAWVMDAEIRIDNAELSVEGDIAKVIVVDTGDPDSYGLFVSVVPIGDQALIDQQQAQAGLLQLQ